MSDAVLDQTILTILEQRLGRERVVKVVAAQLSHGAELLQALTALQQAPDPARIKAIAHQMAGSSGSIGLTKLGEMAGALEMEAPDLPPGALGEAVGRLMAQMRASFARLVEIYPEAAPA
ncbi:MAG TPA: Hpt domain-containing protein [Aliidongia sp.]|uniref:Hpt domain-containing protein n=1 Tax=Aliidongia sp. TaxID=1914230 RepID=UPI002DDD141C|nr:Hpt domain-containing protein [Aliidongia sp.]HEV2673435.1 Hpt domain-containing protein [Aliidongia sp.]